MRPAGSKNKVWLLTIPAAEEMGLTPRQLRRLRADLKFGLHYRSISPASAARPTYQWDCESISDYLGLSPERRPASPRQRRQPAAESR